MDGIQYSRGSGNKLKQTFQEFIAESLFTNTRGSPNTLTLKEAEEEGYQLRSKAFNNKPSKKQKILSFKGNKEIQNLSL